MRPKTKKPELMAPGSDFSSIMTAVESGADSVYFGVRSLNMRANARNIPLSSLPKVMDFLHKHQKKGYLTLNTIVMNSELNKVDRILQEAKKSGVSGIIGWDMAVLSKASEFDQPFCLSTQASVSNFEAFKYYANLGIKRIVLARECTLTQIKEIKKKAVLENIQCEIECFIHGAMCVSISGRCYLSLEAMQKSANRGECSQPCRREFLIKEKEENKSFILGEDYVLSPKDLCTIEFLDELIEGGIDVFKIEGRMRSVEYIKIVTAVYRQAIDLHFENKLTPSLKIEFKKQLSKVYNRGFSCGFYFGRPVDWISRRLEHRSEKIFLGEVIKFYQRISVAEIIIRSNQLTRGDLLMVVGKNTPARFFKAKEIQQEHQWVESIKKGETAGVKVPFKVRGKDQIYIWRDKKNS